MSTFKFINLKPKATGDSITIEWGVKTDIPENEFSQWVYLFLGDDPVGDPVELPQKARSYTIENLKADTEYYVYIQAYQEPEHSPLPEEYCVVKTEAVDTCPPEVSSKVLEVSDLTSDSFKISWKKAKDAVTKAGSIRYTVFLKEADEPETAWAPVVSKKNIGTATIKGLKTGAQYVFYVEAADEAGNVLRYDSGEASTEDKVAPVIKNANLRVVKVSNESITIAWDKATDNVTKESDIEYHVSWIIDGDKGARYGAKLTGAETYTITHLKSGCKYAISVMARDEAGNIQRYADCLAETLDTEAPQIGSGKVRMGPRSDNELAIEWDPATDNVTAASNIKYLVSRSEGNAWGPSNELTGKTSYIFTGLKSGTEYKFRVIAVDEAGNKSEEYPILTAITKDSIAPTVSSNKLTATVEGNNVTLKWTPATDNLTSSDKIKYVVYRQVSGVWKPEKEDFGISSHKITGLVAGTRYTFMVIASDEAGNVLEYPAITADVVKPTLYIAVNGGPAEILPSIVRPYANNGKFNVGQRIVVYLFGTCDSKKVAYPVDNSYVECPVSNSSVLSVRKSGIYLNNQNCPAIVFQFLKNGTSDVSFRVKDPKGNGYLLQQTFTVEVKNPEWEKVAVTGVTLSSSSISLISGQTQQLLASVSPSNATNKSVSWSSGSSSIATVGSNGLVKALNSGNTTVRVTTVDGSKTATTNVKVTSLALHLCYNKSGGGYASDIPVPSIVRPYSDNGKFNCGQEICVYLYGYCGSEKKHFQLDNSYVECSVSNSSVLSIKKSYIGNGCPAILFPFLKNGTSNVTFRVKDPKGSGYLLQQTFTVEVKNPAWEKVAVTGVSLSPSSITLISGQTQQLSTSISPSNATNKSVSWSSGNSSIATVSSTGLVKAVNSGNTTVRVTTVDGSKTASSNVKVMRLEVHICYNKSGGGYASDLLVPSVVQPFANNRKFLVGKNNDHVTVYVYPYCGSNLETSFRLDNSYVECSVSDPSVLSVSWGTIGGGLPAITLNILKTGYSISWARKVRTPITCNVTIRVRDPKGSGYLLQQTFTVDLRK